MRLLIFLYLICCLSQFFSKVLNIQVLRAQPEDIYTFVADYLDALMITRENARVAARLVQSITEITTTTCEFLEEAGMERMEAERVMQVVRATFQKQLQSDTLGAPPPASSRFYLNGSIHILICPTAKLSTDLVDRGRLHEMRKAPVSPVQIIKIQVFT
ncbi:unnamed protein product [Acanthoscelides obtectus]|uniref:Uncharacterized protein n=1 Tax=Acanthoscelides obtectus TaxID=200917 RepID=A0A9P0PDK8_ACAOB|nr:unnamed protein product [Acanthoscelides obtectus]CAK1647354.1 hypothetical protein AOBTE_LOCUS15192 [Acanthoscelides obtectus]